MPWLPYYVGNPQAPAPTLVGRLRLRRQRGSPPPSADGGPTAQQLQQQQPGEADTDQPTGVVLVENMPPFMSPHDFLNYVGPFRDQMRHVRVLGAAGTRTQFFLLIRFSDPAAAGQFRRQLNGKQLTRLSSEVLYVGDVIGLTPPRPQGELMSPAASPADLGQPPRFAARSGGGTPEDDSMLEPSGASAGSAFDAVRPMRLGTPLADVSGAECQWGADRGPCDNAGVNELLGTVEAELECPYCLYPCCGGASQARRGTPVTAPSDPGSAAAPAVPDDQTASQAEPTGPAQLWTTLCGHTAHIVCLERAGESQDDDSARCPVCRFNQQDLGTVCNDCGAGDELWMCLICGHIGCGRRAAGHADAHYRSSAHTYACNVTTNAVWDYAGEGYVHRLIANRADGKIVEDAGPEAGSRDRSARDAELDHEQDLAQAKLRDHGEAMSADFSQLLEEQLEQQRQHNAQEFAQREAALLEAAAERRRQSEQAEAAAEEAEAAAQRDQREAARLEKRCKELERKAAAVEEELENERRLVEQLRSNIPRYHEKLEQLEAAASAAPAPAAAGERQRLEKRIAELMAALDAPQGPAAAAAAAPADAAPAARPKKPAKK